MARIDLPPWGGEDLVHALVLLIPGSDKLCGWGGMEFLSRNSQYSTYSVN